MTKFEAKSRFIKLHNHRIKDNAQWMVQDEDNDIINSTLIVS